MPRPAPASSPLADDHGPIVHAVYRISRMNRTMMGSLLRPLGLFPGQELLLMQLWERDGRSQTDLVTSLGLDPSTVTKMLQRMEKSGWIVRTKDTTDRRVVIISLTKSGRQLRRRVEKAWKVLEAETTAGLSDRQVDQVRSLLRRVEEHVAEIVGAGG
jgi:DNA-binding MarR family transcriptional regulator